MDGSRENLRRCLALLCVVAATASCAGGGPQGAAGPWSGGAAAEPGSAAYGAVHHAGAGTGTRGASAPQRGVVQIPPLPLPRLPGPDVADAAEAGLVFRLRESAPGVVAPGPAGGQDPVHVRALSAAGAAALLARLPSLPAADTAAFRFPTATPPPPRAGRTVLSVFPPPSPADTGVVPGDRPPGRPADGPAAPLVVQRIVPSGETELAPHVTVTFSDAMVPLTTVAGTEAMAPPVRLVPQPPGRWLWVDTRTVRFQPDTRLAMATRYRVEVRPDARSAAGQALAAPVRVEFSTPAARALGAYPALQPGDAGDALLELPPQVYHGMQRTDELARAVGLQPVIVVVFDQQVDPAVVVRSARLTAGGRAWPLRLARSAEVAADTLAGLLTEQAPAGRWVALRPAQPLPRGADVRVALVPGLGSAEGPLTTTVTQELRFRTYGPLRIARHTCGWDEECRPNAPWMIRFTNPLDAAAWDDALMRVEPELPDMRVRVAGAELRITGAARPNTRYRVTLGDGVRDRFGQALEPPRSVTFDVRAAQPTIAIPGAPLVVLDPDGPPRLRVQSAGHGRLRVRVYRVTPAQWSAFGDAIRRMQGQPVTGFAWPGTAVQDTVMAVAGGGAHYGEVLVDAGRAFTDGLGHAIVVVEPPGGLPALADRLMGRASQAAVWVQSTHIGLSAAVDREELLAWASSLRTGQALPGVELRLAPSGIRTTTAADGTARMRLDTSPDNVLLASVGRDTALLPQQVYAWARGGWQREDDAGELRWFTVSDRGLYLPGETVHLKGWLRHVPPRPALALELPRSVTAVAFNLRGPRGEALGSGSMRPGELGGFSTGVELPLAINLGQAAFAFTAEGTELPRQGRGAHHAVQVQEFRRPDYAVAVEADPGPHVVGEPIALALGASYYGGGGLGGARVEWRVSTSAAHYAPPGWDGWRFGRDRAWGLPTSGDALDPVLLTATTDADGAHRLVVEPLSADPPFANMLHVEAEVHDVTRQAGSASAGVLVHPASLNIGLRAARAWAHPGQPVDVEVIVVDHDGRAVPGREPELMLERAAPAWWLHDAGAQVGGDARVACRIVSAGEPVACTVTADSAGTYRLRADIRDDAGRVSRTHLMLWVSGGAGPQRPGQEPGRIEVMPDRASYQPGDTARLMIQAPFQPAELLVTVRSAGVLSTQRLRIDSPGHELQLPITDAHIGGITVHVDLVDGGRGTRFAGGEATLDVPPHRRALDVRVVPRDSIVRPGAQTVIDVEVRDADGRVVPGAEVALWMVDEAVLGLGDFRLGDPLETFYARRHVRLQAQQNRRWLLEWPRSEGPGTVSGTVLGSGGAPLAGVAVRLDGTSIEARTAFDGRFTLRGVRAGEHVLRLDAADGTTGARGITVPAAGVHLGNIVLGEFGVTIAATEFAQETSLQLRAVAAAPPPPGAMMRLDELVVTGLSADAAVDVRADFAPLAFFEPSVRTGADGRASVNARLPGSLTRYRVMAVAVAGADRFGTGEGLVTARQELMVRITAPRFLNHGDTFELPVLLQNATPRTLEVDVAARASGLDIEGDGGRRVTLPPGGRAEVRFAAAATRAGTAHVQVIAAAAGAERAASAGSSPGSAAYPALTDAASAMIPVYTPATLEAFAVYGTLDSNAPAVLPLARPVGVIGDFGGLEVGITSTALHALTDAVLYLHAYPFEGAEHVASRVLAVAALRDVLAAFAADGLPAPEELESATRRDIATLAGMQLSDGGWPFWRGMSEASPFVSTHVAHALQRAQEKGFAVPAHVLEQAGGYLRGMERHVARWPLPARQGALAYALYVRQRLGDVAAAQEAARMARATPAQVGGELTVEAVAWLLHVLAADPRMRPQADELRRVLLNRVVETAAGAAFAERFDDGAELLLHSRRRTDAVALEALMAADPGNDLVPKLAQSLLAQRTSGRWSGTQENAWALLALDRYFRTYEATTPSFESRAWLGERFAGAHTFEGRTTERQHISIPMPELLRADARELVIARQGAGRLYYRAGLRYAPADTRVPALERGFTVARTYEAVDDDGDVRRDDAGTWHVRAGARVRVRVLMTAPSVRYHVALTDALPAGLEPLNPELRGTGFTDDVPDPPATARGAAPGTMRGAGSLPAPWREQWFTHQNLRDDRAEAFTDVLRAGSYEYTYLARATTPGTFIVPPPRAEMMYEPEVFGRGAGDTVVVAERPAGG
jgi:alpha-2-macroglobulin